MFGFFKKKHKSLSEVEMKELQVIVAENIDRLEQFHEPIFRTLSKYDILIAFLMEDQKVTISLFQLSKCKVVDGFPVEVHNPPISMISREITNSQDFDHFMDNNNLQALSKIQTQVVYYIMSLVRSIKRESVGIPLDEYNKLNQEFTKEMDYVNSVLNGSELHVWDLQTCDGSLYRIKDTLVSYFMESFNNEKVFEHESWYNVFGMISAACFQHSLIKATLGEYQLSRDLIEIAAELYPNKQDLTYLNNCKQIWNNANSSIVDEDGSFILYSSFNRIDSILENKMSFNDYFNQIKQLAGYE